ncbi:MAG: lipase family protein [Mariniblastus sp.]|nr:lipase family protein [Mariniblastus sp.]
MANATHARKKLAKKKAVEFAFKSNLQASIAELSLLRQSLLFSEISMISYLSVQECNIAAGKLGFTDGKFFDCGDTQAYWFQNEHDSVVVFCSKEISDSSEIRKDANAMSARAQTVGKVHRRFQTEADEIWPHIEKSLEVNRKPLWFCGHSLGGAIATICAGRAMISHIKTEPEGVFSFGSPRVGCRRYVNYIKIPLYRWVNNNDIVTRLPSALLGYRHSGTKMCIDRMGHLKKNSIGNRLGDSLQEIFSGWMGSRNEQFSDHYAPRYVDSIFNIIRVAENRRNKQTGSKDLADIPTGIDLNGTTEAEASPEPVSDAVETKQKSA